MNIILRTTYYLFFISNFCLWLYQPSALKLRIVQSKYVDDYVVKYLKKEIEKEFNVEVVISKDEDISEYLKPDNTILYKDEHFYIVSEDMWDASDALYIIDELYPKDDKVLFVSTLPLYQDYYSDAGNGICSLNFKEALVGYGEQPGKNTIISLNSSNVITLLDDAKASAFHELGHTYGLGHCEDTLCYMVDHKVLHSDYFCKKCQKQLNEAERRIR